MCGPQLHGGTPAYRQAAGRACPAPTVFPYCTIHPAQKQSSPPDQRGAELLHAVQRNIIDDLTGADQTGNGGDVGVAAGDLAVQVRQADLVIVDQVQRADVCQPCKV